MPNFFALSGSNAAPRVYRIQLVQAAQRQLDATFRAAARRFRHEDVQSVAFNGNYKPDDDEILEIANFQPPQSIVDAIDEPGVCERLNLAGEANPNIRAIFSEIDGSVIFQSFRQSQYLETRRSFLFEENTFRQLDRPGIVVQDEVHATITGRTLSFRSFFIARQIFDLTGFFREATRQEVTAFVRCPLLLADEDGFQEAADSWVRRKVASITESGVLDNYTAAQLATIARREGVAITRRNGRLVLPPNKAELKNILRFLDEDLYSGPITQSRFATNSKRSRV